VGRNEPCPCGSGKRYKDCHGSLAAPPEKVAFVIAGTQKGGTTALASYLYEHPEIGMPTVKEVHFFDTEDHFASAEVDYAKYHAYFDPAVRKRLLGDATPIYMYWDAAPPRIWQYNPAMKLILLLRNPITRAYSQWNMERERGSDPLRSSRRSGRGGAQPRRTAVQHRLYYTWTGASTATSCAGSGAIFRSSKRWCSKARSCSKRPRLRWRASPISSASRDLLRSPRAPCMRGLTRGR
jgi:hypothetical protein